MDDSSRMVIYFNVLLYRYSGGPSLPCQVICGWNSSTFIVEIYPLTLKYCKSSAVEEVFTITLSKAITVGEMKTKMCQQMNLNPNNVCVWDYYGNKKYKLLEGMTKTLQYSQIIDGQSILLEETNI
jgi:hypothetical protein